MAMTEDEFDALSQKRQRLHRARALVKQWTVRREEAARMLDQVTAELSELEGDVETLRVKAGLEKGKRVEP